MASPSPDEALPLAVGITTLPSRIDRLRPTLDSLTAQTRRPDEIFLSLPRRSFREGRAYDRPAWLGEYEPLLEVVDCIEDWGPSTKLLGCLDRLAVPTCLVVADDDMRYRPDFLEGLYRHQCADPRSSFSYWTYRYGPFTIGQGADGFSFHSPNLAGIRAFAERALRCQALRLIDDIWISALLMRHGIAIKSLNHLVEGARTIYEPAHTVNQLSAVEGKLGRGAVMIAGARHLQESGLMGRRAQAMALLKKAYRGGRSLLCGAATVPKRLR
jgi:hypothetical protein